MAEEGFRRLIVAEERGLERMTGDPADALEQVLDVYVSFAIEHPAHFEERGHGRLPSARR